MKALPPVLDALARGVAGGATVAVAKKLVLYPLEPRGVLEIGSAAALLDRDPRGLCWVFFLQWGQPDSLLSETFSPQNFVSQF